ncbi:MAG: OmpA family protein [Bacteroidales bacterium]|nr:OmpA family protein [Bacteroidales bacterium]
MKKICIMLIAGILMCGMGQSQAQNKNTGTSSKTSTKKSKTAKTSTRPQIVETPLPEQSNDCLYAIDLSLDIPYGPTTAPTGAGRIQEIMRDKTHPNLFEYEHNSVWYKITIPYNGDLELNITQSNPLDDYDFLVYRYTDVYFSNHLIQNKVLPLAANLSAVDSSVKAGQPSIGMSVKAKNSVVTKNSKERFVKSIPVKKGEVYYIVLDNNSVNGSGHTITASINVEFFTPTVQFYDPVDKKFVIVDLLVLEKNTDDRPIVRNAEYKGGKIKFVPGFTYKLYANREGYFSIYKEFNSNVFKEDTLLRFTMHKAAAGAVFSLSNVYFSDNVELLPESDTALLDFVTMMSNHPDVKFKIKGYVQSYGVDMENDIKVSIERAQVVRQFFVDHGIEADRMTVVGMTQNEIKRSAAAALNKSKPFKDARIELIITEAAPLAKKSKTKK